MEEIQKDSYKDIISTALRTIAFVWKREKITFSILIIVNTIGAVVYYFQLISFSTIIDEIIRIKSLSLDVTNALIKNSIFLGISFFIPALISNVDSFLFNSIRLRLGTQINLHLVDTYSSFDVGTVESSEFQKKRDRANKWGQGSLNNTVYWSVKVYRGVISFITAGVVLYTINPFLVIFAIAGALPYYFIEQIYGKKIFSLTWVQTDESRLESNRMDHFKDPKKIVEVLLFNLKKFFRKQIEDIANAYDKKLISIYKKESLTTLGADVFESICLFLVIGFVTLQTLKGNLLIGSLFLAFTSYRGFLSTTQTFFTDYARMTEQARYAKYWFDIFDIKPRITSIENALKPDWSIPPIIEFKNVSFSYPEMDKKVLNNISFRLESGEKLAIVGENGAGKTTLIKLLSRVYDPIQGEILINGINLKQIDLNHWHDYLGVLLQDFVNYQMTVKESIAISRPGEPINEDSLEKAAEMSGANDFIQEFPKKYDQLIWKGFHDGVDLSKGQYQRLAVARILYRDALISILDEPTSAIDAVAEEKIFEVLETKMTGKTVILISHRFSTVKNADQIAVIEHGELKEIGNHKELIKKNGGYAELYNMQASRYLEN